MAWLMSADYLLQAMQWKWLAETVEMWLIINLDIVFLATILSNEMKWLRDVTIVMAV